jgi:hypothetical protein
MNPRFLIRLYGTILLSLTLAKGVAVLAGSTQVGSGVSPKQVVKIDKFQILASYTYTRALRDGMSDREAKERGIVAAVMGARSRGVGRGSRSQAGGSSATSARKKTLTAELYDREVSSKLGPFYDSVLLPTMRKLIDARLSYEQVKQVLEIPSSIGATIAAEEFANRTSAYLKRRASP